MTPLRESVRTRPDGWREVVMACPCARFGLLVATWEDAQAALDDLHARHRDECPRCPHRLRLPTPREGDLR